MSSSPPTSDAESRAPSAPLAEADRSYLHRRVGPNRSREIAAALRHLSPGAQQLFIRTLRAVPADVPGGEALMLAYARFCNTAAEIACASKEGPARDAEL